MSPACSRSSRPGNRDPYPWDHDPYAAEPGPAGCGTGCPPDCCPPDGLLLPTDAEMEKARRTAADLIETLAEDHNLIEVWLSLAMAKAAGTHAIEAAGLTLPDILVIDPDNGDAIAL